MAPSKGGSRKDEDVAKLAKVSHNTAAGNVIPWSVVERLARVSERERAKERHGTVNDVHEGSGNGAEIITASQEQTTRAAYVASGFYSKSDMLRIVSKDGQEVFTPLSDEFRLAKHPAPAPQASAKDAADRDEMKRATRECREASVIRAANELHQERILSEARELAEQEMAELYAQKHNNRGTNDRKAGSATSSKGSRCTSREVFSKPGSTPSSRTTVSGSKSMREQVEVAWQAEQEEKKTEFQSEKRQDKQKRDKDDKKEEKRKDERKSKKRESSKQKGEKSKKDNSKPELRPEHQKQEQQKNSMEQQEDGLEQEKVRSRATVPTGSGNKAASHSRSRQSQTKQQEDQDRRSQQQKDFVYERAVQTERTKQWAQAQSSWRPPSVQTISGHHSTSKKRPSRSFSRQASQAADWPEAPATADILFIREHEGLDCQDGGSIPKSPLDPGTGIDNQHEIEEAAYQPTEASLQAHGYAYGLRKPSDRGMKTAPGTPCLTIASRSAESRSDGQSGFWEHASDRKEPYEYEQHLPASAEEPRQEPQRHSPLRYDFMPYTYHRAPSISGSYRSANHDVDGDDSPSSSSYGRIANTSLHNSEDDEILDGQAPRPDQRRQRASSVSIRRPSTEQPSIYEWISQRSDVYRPLSSDRSSVSTELGGVEVDHATGQHYDLYGSASYSSDYPSSRAFLPRSDSSSDHTATPELCRSAEPHSSPYTLHQRLHKPYQRLSSTNQPYHYLSPVNELSYRSSTTSKSRRSGTKMQNGNGKRGNGAFAGHGWISPHPLSVSTSELEQRPQGVDSEATARQQKQKSRSESAKVWDRNEVSSEQHRTTGSRSGRFYSRREEKTSRTMEAHGWYEVGAGTVLNDGRVQLKMPWDD